MCLVAKPLNKSEAKGDLVTIQMVLLFKSKFFCYHASKILVSVTTRSPSALLQIKGLATKYTTIKWPIGCQRTGQVMSRAVEQCALIYGFDSHWRFFSFYSHSPEIYQSIKK